MKNWVKLKTNQEKKLSGGFAISSVLAIWGMTLFTGIVIRSLFAEKGSATVNGAGRMSWDDKPNPPDSEKNISTNKASSLELEKFMGKFYEF